MGVKVQRNTAQIEAKIGAGSKAAVIAATEAVIEYANIFVREDQGTLKDSSLIASKPEQGKAIWDTPYARKVYYTGKPSKDKNPQASLKWAEVAVKTYGKDIEAVAQNAFTKGMGGGK